MKQSSTKDISKLLRGKSERERFLHRLHCVSLVQHGLSCSEVARIFGDSPRSVAYWAAGFEKSGLDALKEEARSGRPSKLNPSQVAKIKSLLVKNPSLTGQILSKHVKETFEIDLTARQCWRLLKQLRSPSDSSF